MPHVVTYLAGAGTITHRRWRESSATIMHQIECGCVSRATCMSMHVRYAPRMHIVNIHANSAVARRIRAPKTGLTHCYITSYKVLMFTPTFITLRGTMLHAR